MPEQDMSLLRRRGAMLLVLLNAFVVVLILSYALGAFAELREMLHWDRGLEVAITGEGKISARPDVAKVTLTVLTEDPTLLAAQSENSQKSQDVTEYLKGQGIQEKDIKTSGYNIYPQYSFPRPCTGGVCPVDGEPRIVGYQVRTTYEVTIRDLSKAGDLLTGIVEAGVNEVGNFYFTIDNPEELRAEARQQAVENAREKAEALAENLGKSVGDIVTFSESGGGVPPPIFYRGGEAAVDIKAVSVEPGENEITVNVSIVYEFN